MEVRVECRERWVEGVEELKACADFFKGFPHYLAQTDFLLAHAYASSPKVRLRLSVFRRHRFTD